MKRFLKKIISSATSHIQLFKLRRGYDGQSGLINERAPSRLSKIETIKYKELSRGAERNRKDSQEHLDFMKEINTPKMEIAKIKLRNIVTNFRLSEHSWRHKAIAVGRKHAIRKFRKERK